MSVIQKKTHNEGLSVPNKFNFVILSSCFVVKRPLKLHNFSTNKKDEKLLALFSQTCLKCDGEERGLERNQTKIVLRKRERKKAKK